MSNDFSELLNHFVARCGYTAGQVAQHSGVAKNTIVRWLAGPVRHPHAAADLIQVAVTLNLSPYETNQLLQAAKHPPLPMPVAQASGRSSPFQAIPDLPTFVGRQQALAQLEGWLCAAHHPSVYCLSGMGGVGKTVLAARLAYKLRPFFPDGVLWARLDQTAPMSLLQLFAAAYGEDVRDYDDLDSRSQAVRMILADKRLLLVLDNVSSSEQVWPLLPPTGVAAVLLTSRRRNLSLVEKETHLHLEPFGLEESLLLLTRLLGAERVAAEQATLTAVSDTLHHLPLSLAIVGRRLAADPCSSAHDWLHQLQQQPLAALADESQSVQATLTLSYACLPVATQQFFAALADFGSLIFTPDMAASRAAVPVETARHYLASLYNLSLVHSGGADSYRLIPLIAQFAKNLPAD